MTPPSQIAHYRITSKLGEGGMGAVYRATDTKLNRDVAIKVLPPAFAEDAARMQRFEREAQVLASLNHPNIGAIYGIEQGAIVMELVEGEDLKGPLPVDIATAYARQIAAGLEAAHEKGIVHRDLKPANIKVTPDGTVKLLDFGLAKAAEPAAATSASAAASPTQSPTLSLAMTQAGMILGTAAYMAPEQARGKLVDRRADIWAFGVVLFEMLAGRQLFAAGDTVTDIIAAVVTREPDWSLLPADTPPHLRRLLERCLRKEPRLRLQAIGDARIMVDEPDPAPTASAPAPAKEPRFPWIAAALAGIAAVGLGAAWWLATRPVERPLMRFSVELDPEAVAGQRTTAAISPDGMRLVYSVRTAGGGTQLATRRLDQSTSTLLHGAENAADPFFSPDGQWVGFAAGGQLKKISVAGGAALTLCDAPALRGASWGEDGSIIASLNARTLSRVPAGGGPPKEISRPAEGVYTHRWPQVLPGGKAVLFTLHTIGIDFDNASIAALDLATGSVKILRRGGYFGRYLPSGHLVYVNQGVLMGIRFDPAKLETEGDAAPLLEGVKGNVATGGGQFDVSRTGTLVYLPGTANAGKFPMDWMDPTGKTHPLISTPGIYSAPRFSPDGRLLALDVFERDGRDISVYDLSRDTLTRITFRGAATPVWAPDGRRLVYATLGGLFWTRSDGSGAPQRLVESKGAIQPGSISPDGRWLAYAEVTPETGFDILVRPLDLSNPEQPQPGAPAVLVQSSQTDAQPEFSPDGRWLAYSSGESGRAEVYVRPFSGGKLGAGRWLVSNEGGNRPRWSRATRELLYEAPDHHIMAVAYTTNADSFAAGKPRLWTEAPVGARTAIGGLWDLAPDGKRLAAVRPGALEANSGPLRVAVLLNFFDEVHRRIK